MKKVLFIVRLLSIFSMLLMSSALFAQLCPQCPFNNCNNCWNTGDGSGGGSSGGGNQYQGGGGDYGGGGNGSPTSCTFAAIQLSSPIAVDIWISNGTGNGFVYIIPSTFNGVTNTDVCSITSQSVNVVRTHQGTGINPSTYSVTVSYTISCYGGLSTNSQTTTFTVQC